MCSMKTDPRTAVCRVRCYWSGREMSGGSSLPRPFRSPLQRQRPIGRPRSQARQRGGRRHERGVAASDRAAQRGGWGRRRRGGRRALNASNVVGWGRREVEGGAQLHAALGCTRRRRDGGWEHEGALRYVRRHSKRGGDRLAGAGPDAGRRRPCVASYTPPCRALLAPRGPPARLPPPTPHAPLTPRP